MFAFTYSKIVGGLLVLSFSKQKHGTLLMLMISTENERIAISHPVSKHRKTRRPLLVFDVGGNKVPYFSKFWLKC